MEILINKLFIACVNTIYWLEYVSGVSYEAWNLILFVFLQPLLIVLFFLLWVRARYRLANNTDYGNHHRPLLDPKKQP